MGDYVSPPDFRRCVFCRVVAAESIAYGAQVLWLEPLEGPWPRGTHLVRLDDAVRPVLSQPRAAFSATNTVPRAASTTATTAGCFSLRSTEIA